MKTREIVAIPGTPLGVASNGELDASRAGRDQRVSGLPTPVFDETGAGGAFTYLQDLRYDSDGARVVSLTAPDSHASAVCVAASYRYADSDEQLKTLTWSQTPPDVDGIGPRDHKVIAKFGTAGTWHEVMCDVLEGNVVNLPGSHAEVRVVDLSWHRARSGSIDPAKFPLLVSQASAASFRAPSRATVTTRVYTPMEYRLFSLQNPPTRRTYACQLLEACMFRQFHVYDNGPGAQ